MSIGRHRNPALQRAILSRAACGPVTSAVLASELPYGLQNIRRHLQMLANDGHLRRRPAPRTVVITYDLTTAGRAMLAALQTTPEERRRSQIRAVLDLAHALGYPTAGASA